MKAKMIFSSIVLLFHLFPGVSALYDRQASGAPIPPSVDPFYKPPAGFESALPGTILASRPIPKPLGLLGVVNANVSAAYQILYRTTDTHGNAMAAMTTVIVPYNADPTKLESYQAAYDSPSVDCATSQAIQKDSSALNILTQAELLIMNAFLNKGYFINTPDYEGPRAAFTAGYVAGQATLDSIRAVLSSKDITGIGSNVTVTMSGYSGGALATGWAAQLQATYASELKIAGAAFGGVTPDILNVLYRVNKSFWAGLIPAGVQGLAHEYPELLQYILDNIRPEKLDDFTKAANYCLPESLSTYLGQDVFGYLKDPNAINGEIPKRILAENRMGNATPSMPMYIYKSENDGISATNDTDIMVSRWCDEGANIEYVKDLLSNHVTTEFTGTARAFQWLDARLRGDPVMPGCKNIESITSLLDPGTIEALGLEVWDGLMLILGNGLGPQNIALNETG